jgi:hypothetical protein
MRQSRNQINALIPQKSRQQLEMLSILLPETLSTTVVRCPVVIRMPLLVL